MLPLWHLRWLKQLNYVTRSLPLPRMGLPAAFHPVQFPKKTLGTLKNEALGCVLSPHIRTPHLPPVSGTSMVWWNIGATTCSLISVISAFSWSSLCSALHRSSRWAWGSQIIPRDGKLWQKTNKNSMQHCDLESLKFQPKKPSVPLTQAVVASHALRSAWSPFSDSKHVTLLLRSVTPLMGVQPCQSAMIKPQKPMWQTPYNYSYAFDLWIGFPGQIAKAPLKPKREFQHLMCLLRCSLRLGPGLGISVTGRRVAGSRLSLGRFPSRAPTSFPLYWTSGVPNCLIYPPGN